MTTPAAATPPAGPDATALAQLLAVQQATVYGYGVAGSVLGAAGVAGAPALRLLSTAFDAHRARRDQLRAAVLRAGGDPPVAAAAYRLPFPVRDPASAVRLATYLEDALGRAALQTVGATTAASSARASAVATLLAAAAQAAAYRRSGGVPPARASTAFPGR